MSDRDRWDALRDAVTAQSDAIHAELVKATARMHAAVNDAEAFEEARRDAARHDGAIGALREVLGTMRDLGHAQERHRGGVMAELSVRCDWEEACNCGEGTAQCRNSSRFRVERSDHDPSYRVSSDRAPAEACEIHIADTIFALMDGNDKITAIVTPRWD